MATYAIGDVQGCFDELQELLQLLNFDREKDTLWFAGDLVNRGPKSLEVLRFIKNLPKSVVVLGNHDLHLLSIAHGHPFKDHALFEVLAAPDREELITWLRHQPLLHYDQKLAYVMVHAGIPPQWSLQEAKRHAHEVEKVLHSSAYAEFLEHLYGNKPTKWHSSLKGWGRLRFITNAFTRIRFCDPQGNLDLSTKGVIGSQPSGYLPWFEIPGRAMEKERIVFGHWAALDGKTDNPNVFALDTGCVWGRYLTALRLEDAQRFAVRSKIKPNKLSKLE